MFEIFSGRLFAKLDSLDNPDIEYGRNNKADYKLTELSNDANLVTSLVDQKKRIHMPALDIDIPVRLIPSSTVGRSHLFLDIELSEEEYFKLMDALVDAGILEDKYAEHSRDKGFSSLRLPWISKLKEYN